MKKIFCLIMTACSLIYGDYEGYVSFASDLITRFDQCRKQDSCSGSISMQADNETQGQGSTGFGLGGISLLDGSVQMPTSLGVACLVVHLIRSWHDVYVFKKHVQALPHVELVKEFPGVEVASDHIARFDTMIQLSCHGTLPEKIVARIFLAKQSLFQPYDKLMYQMHQTFISLNFDKQGRFTLKEKHKTDIIFKDFYKKVPQDYKKLLLNLKQLPDSIDAVYQSCYATQVDNDYNQTLLDMIYAGIDQNFPRLKKLCRKYYDYLTKRLYQYYLDQKTRKCCNEDGVYQSADHDPIIQELPSESRLEVSKQKQEELILRDFYQQELQSWLLQGNDQLPYNQQMYRSMQSGKAVLNLPLEKNYRFGLLHKFLNKICKGSQTLPEIAQEFFADSGVLKKYRYHPWVTKHKGENLLDDELFHRAVNFALAIVEKEQDHAIKKISEKILSYATKISCIESEQEFEIYKHKVSILYEALSKNSFDETIFQI